MKKTSSRPKKARSRNGEMRREYDFSGGVRGKYAKQYAQGTNIVALAPDIADEFPTAKEVNQALRKVLKMREARRTD
jgi:hypothetical protein